MNYEKGQFLIELIIAIGIFVIVASSLAFLIFSSYTVGRLSSEVTQANLLAEEGLEAARSIRDNSWNDLILGDYGLDNSTGYWKFLGASEIIDGKFTRITEVTEIDPDNPDPDRKKVTSKVTWQFTEARPQEVKLVTYLTNWQKVLASYCDGTCTLCADILDNKLCRVQGGCSWNGKLKICFDNPGCASCDSYTIEPECITQDGCRWMMP